MTHVLVTGAAGGIGLAVAQAFAGRGDTVTGNFGHAKQVMADLAAVGIDFNDVVKVLEDEGVEKFEASWVELLEGVDKSLKAAASGAKHPSDAA